VRCPTTRVKWIKTSESYQQFQQLLSVS
jgi:hypothetical protein